MIPPIDSTIYGQLGVDYITDTNARTGDWGAIYSAGGANGTTNTTFTKLTGSNVSLNGAAPVSGNMNTLVIAPGYWIYGRFSEITLAGGSILAHRVK